MASRTSYASSTRYVRNESCVCSRSHGQPPGALSLACRATRASKSWPTEGFSLHLLSASAFLPCLLSLMEPTDSARRCERPFTDFRREDFRDRTVSKELPLRQPRPN